MVKLVEINENNWLDAMRLSVSDEQKGFLDRPTGILARGYAYRHCRACVWGIAVGGRLIGLAMVRDMDEEPACYELQQFMIDQRYQGHGYGTEALRQILTLLATERKYDCVEVCVKNTAHAALRVYEKVGFADTGYIDDELPDCWNLRYHFQ